MSKACRRRKSYHSGSDVDNAVFAFFILLICSVWTHKEGILQIEHKAKYVALGVVGGVILLLIVRYRRKIGSCKRKLGSSDMAVIDNMTGIEFEHFVVKLLDSQGYGAIRLTEEYDYGIDIIAVKEGITWGIQVKRYSGLVKADAVRQAVTALKRYHCDRAMVVTNSTYSRVAIDLARSNDCALVERRQLISWIG